MSGELPPEAQAVIDAALAFRAAPLACDVDEHLCRAVDAYRKATAPPEPFEAYLHGADQFIRDPDNGSWYLDLSSKPEDDDDVTYRCAVTPIERVR